ncbi:MAG: hypothetical protein AAF674_06770 [Pseudomonadota bacterium]
MADPIPIPSRFSDGVPLSARLLNALQEEILRQLYTHTHEGGNQGPQLKTGAYEDRSVTEPKLADGAISARTLAEGAVGPENLADDAVTQRSLADDAVGNRHIADNAVSEANLDANVRLKLNRLGGGVSSASTVIWRDPWIVFRPPPSAPPLVATFVEPEKVYWVPPMIGLDDNDAPIRLNPRVINQGGQAVLDSYDILDGDKLQMQEPVLAKIVTQSVQIAGQEVGAVGAFRLAPGAMQAIANLGLGSGPAEAAEEDISGGSPTRMMMMRAMTAAPTSGTGRRDRASAAAVAATASAPPPQPLALTTNGKQAAVRMTTVGVIDENGRPAQPGDDGSFTVTSGFPGKEAFTADGPVVDYRSVGNQADKQRAAKGGAFTLYNLGIDAQYLQRSDTKFDNDLEEQAFTMLLNGNSQFFDQNTKFWGTKSWLPDLLNNPQLFGSGYAISGGRNILSVTRIPDVGKSGFTTVDDNPSRLRATAAASTQQMDGWVRVRFITPYKDAAYAVSVTPRSAPGGAIIAHIKTKTKEYCDLEFLTLSMQGFGRVNKLNFDLAVFGELAEQE